MNRNRKEIPAVVVMFFALLCSTDAFATQKAQSGIELGINCISLRYENPWDIWDPGSRVGYSIGAFVEIPVTAVFSLQTGLRFVQLGNKVDFNTDKRERYLGERSYGEFKIFQNYLTLPILAQVNVIGHPKLFFIVGAEAGYLISARFKSTETVESQFSPSYQKRTTDGDISDAIEPYNFSAISGLGIEFKISSHLLRFQSQYSHGLVDTAKEPEWSSSWKTREMRTTIGYSF